MAKGNTDMLKNSQSKITNLIRLPDRKRGRHYLSRAIFVCGVAACATVSTNVWSSNTLHSDDFETGFGGWRNVSSGDNKNWSRDSNGTPSSGTGPSAGADASAYYLYLETSSGSAYSAGDSAILLGPEISGSGVHLNFKYHMYGSNIGSLAVDVLSHGGWVNNVWKISGQQQTSNQAAYIPVDVDLSAYTVEQLRFRATAIGGYRGDIALDNINISTQPSGPVAPVFNANPLVKPAAYQNREYTGSISQDAKDDNGDSLSFSKVSGPDWLTISENGDLTGTPGSNDVGENSFVVQVSDGNLSSNTTMQVLVHDLSTPVVLDKEDFENGFGHWVNVSTGDNKNWTRDSNGTPSSGTGPAKGGFGSANYVYFETSSGAAYSTGDTAILQGPAITDDNIQLKFQYHMYGSDIGSLAVDVLEQGNWKNDVWIMLGQQHFNNNDEYTNVEINLSQHDVSQIRFRAKAAGGYRGDIALDNIEVTSLPPVATDSDNDGVIDENDQCPGTPAGESVDVNGCSSSQQDRDGDGVPDVSDAFPDDPAEWLDSDNDGIGNNADFDDDNDGVPDDNDDLPLDPNESVDTDSDGIGNNADPDDDNDGVLDQNDAFPLDSSESLDSDLDGIGNNADPDDDNDGVLDQNDAFPLDASESVDTDSDGIGNNADTDDDNDGVLDGEDAFPLDSNEFIDSDGDGIGNNADLDDDNDGVNDEAELTIYHTNPLSADTDNDGMPDGWEILYELNPTLDDAQQNYDGDSLNNIDEFLAGTNPAVATYIPTDKVDDLSLGTSESCAISQGKLSCWGLRANYPIPSSLTAPSKVAVSDFAVCSQQSNNVICWGEDTSSLVTELQATPVNNATVLDVSTSGTACVVNLTGKVHCWGANSFDVATPTNGLDNIKQVDIFQFHACSHNGDNVECWGRNSALQIDVPTDLGKPIDIAVGGLHSCVLQDDNQVRCWGDNTQGQTTLPSDLGKVVDIVAGYYHTCALNETGKVNCWGRNNLGQLDIPATLAKATQLYSGFYNTCANTIEGIACWGRNNYGESSIWYNLKEFAVGDDHVCGINNTRANCFGNQNNEPKAIKVPANLNNPVTIGAGRYHSCVWTTNGMSCWGKDGDHLNAPANLTNVSEIDADESHSCAISNGVVNCWGRNFFGVQNIPTTLVQPEKLAVSKTHNCVIDGAAVKCWGDNTKGQAGSRSNLSNPSALATGGVSTDTSFSCVADDNGVQCWGANTLGVLNEPAGLTNVIDLHAGWGAACALLSSGNVSCWGDYMTESNIQQINIGSVTQINGRNNKVCSRNSERIKCTDGGGVLLLN